MQLFRFKSMGDCDCVQFAGAGAAAVECTASTRQP